jgi:hypothetical protein
MKAKYCENFRALNSLKAYYTSIVLGGRTDDDTMLRLLESSGRYEAAKQEQWEIYADLKAERARQRALEQREARAAKAAAKTIAKASGRFFKPRRSAAPLLPPAAEKVVWTPPPLTWD